MSPTRSLGHYRRHCFVAVVLIAAGISALVAGQGQIAALCFVITGFVIPFWAIGSAANRQHAVLMSASHEQKEAWRAASEGKVKPLDIPWRSGSGGG